MSDLTHVGTSDAIVLSAAITVQCLGCGSTLILEVYNAGIAELPKSPTPSDYDELADLICEGAQQCPSCTDEQKRPVTIEAAILVGRQLDVLPDSETDLEADADAEADAEPNEPGN